MGYCFSKMSCSECGTDWDGDKYRMLTMLTIPSFEGNESGGQTDQNGSVYIAQKRNLCSRCIMTRYCCTEHRDFTWRRVSRGSICVREPPKSQTRVVKENERGIMLVHVGGGESKASSASQDDPMITCLVCEYGSDAFITTYYADRVDTREFKEIPLPGGGFTTQGKKDFENEYNRYLSMIREMKGVIEINKGHGEKKKETLIFTSRWSSVPGKKPDDIRPGEHL